MTFAWVQTAGAPAAVLTGANTSKPTFVAPRVPVGQTTNALTFSVAVNNGATTIKAPRVVTITVLPPTPNAGTPQTVPSGATVTLNGSASTDPNLPPRPLTFVWTQTSARQ